MQIYVVYTDRWVGSYPDFYIDGVFKHEKDAWKYIESKYNKFMESMSALVKIISVRINSNNVVIHYEDNTSRYSIAYRISMHELQVIQGVEFDG